MIHDDAEIEIWDPQIAKTFGKVLFFDCGANVGDITLQFFQKAGKETVAAYLFEPNYTICNALKKPSVVIIMSKLSTKRLGLIMNHRNI